MKKVILFGLGNDMSKKLLSLDKNNIEIVAYADNDNRKWNKNGVIDPVHINDVDFDYIIITTQAYEEEVICQLLTLNIPEEKIVPYNLSASDLLKFEELFSKTGILINYMDQVEKKIIRQIPNYLEMSYNLDSAQYLKQCFSNEKGELKNDCIFSEEGRSNYYEYVVKNYVKKSDQWKNGLCMEFGVYKGFSINTLAMLLEQKIIYGFDSFEGLPENWLSNRKKGHFSLGGDLPGVRENVRLIKGWFDQTLPKFLSDYQEEKCCLIHIDCDLYSSTKIVLDYLEKYIVPGTVIMFDEFVGYIGYQGHEYRAFNEFLDKTGYSYQAISAYITRGATKVAFQIR